MREKANSSEGDCTEIAYPCAFLNTAETSSWTFIKVAGGLYRVLALLSCP